MLFPYPFDLIPEMLGRLLAALFSWHCEGKRVILRVTEGEQDFYGMIVCGTIDRIAQAEKDNQFVLIRLDSVWKYENRTTSSTSMVVTAPRFRGHGVYRLLLSTAEVNVFPVEVAETPFATANWKDMIAICNMKLVKRHTEQSLTDKKVKRQ